MFRSRVGGAGVGCLGKAIGFYAYCNRKPWEGSISERGCWVQSRSEEPRVEGT